MPGSDAGVVCLQPCAGHWHHEIRREPIPANHVARCVKASTAISVVIRTRDSARTLERVSVGLGKAEGDEVIVVDSGSRDATLDIAKKYGAIIVLAPGPFHYSKSLN